MTVMATLSSNGYVVLMSTRIPEGRVKVAGANAPIATPPSEVVKNIMLANFGQPEDIKNQR